VEHNISLDRKVLSTNIRLEQKWPVLSKHYGFLMYTLHIKLACLLVQASVFVEARSLIRTLTIFHQLQIRNVLQHMPQGQCYKTFYGRKLRLFIIS
jgi:hypothetical protein